ncbi:MAG: LPS export ABC transporter periplasmic protein LptC [Desulfurivibrio sp.]
MMHGIRNLLWLIPLLLLLGWPLYGGGVRAFLAPPPLQESDLPARAEAPPQRFSMEKVRFYQDEAGVRRLRIDTPSLRTDQQSDNLLLAAIDAVMFREDREHLFVSAERGLYDTAAEVLHLEDNVQLREAEHLRLTTPALSYHEREGRVSSRAGVEISSAEIFVRGQNFDYDLEAGSYLLTGNVSLITR